MALRFYIDDQLVNQPDNDTEVTTTINRDIDLGGFLVTQDIQLKWSKEGTLQTGEVDGYTYLKSLYDSGTCNQATIIIWDEVSDTTSYRIFTGVIKVPAMEIEYQRVQISVGIDDNNYYSYLKNNQNIKFSLYATKTKNGVPVTPPELYDVDMFNSATGVYLSGIGELYKQFRLYDVLKFLIPAISDGKVTFESDFLIESDTQLFITDGYALATPNASPDFEISFSEIIQEVFKLKNLAFYIDQTDPDAPVFRLERQSWFFVGTTLLTLEDVFTLRSSIKTKRLYGTVKVGSEFNPGGAGSTYTFNAGTSYFGWKEEIYAPYGQCNNANELDLLSEWAISSNAVNDQVNGVTTSNFDRLFVVECDSVDTGAFTASAVQYDELATGSERFYNMGLNNVRRLQIHGGNYQAALNNTQDPNDNVFHASGGQDVLIGIAQTGQVMTITFNPTIPAVIEPSEFSDEFGGINYDPGGNYDNTLFFYTAPLDGVYSFAADIHAETQNLKFCDNGVNVTFNGTNFAIGVDGYWGVNLKVEIKVYANNTFATLLNSSSQTYQITQNGTGHYGVSGVYNLQVGNVVRVRTETYLLRYVPAVFGGSPVPYGQGWNVVDNTGMYCFSYNINEPKIQIYSLADSTFQCNGTPNGAVIIATPDPQLYKIKQYEFSYPISAGDFQRVLAMPIGQIVFTKDDIERIGWIENLQYNHWKGEARIKLISQDATT